MTNSVYDPEEDQSVGDKIDGLEQSFRDPSATNSGSKTLVDRTRQEKKEAKKQAKIERDQQNVSKALGVRESQASAGSEINDKLGKGYNGDKSKKTFTSKMFNNKGGSALKKKIAIAGAAAGGSLILSIIVFFALLPLKIEHVVSNLENKFTATATTTLDNQTEKLYSSWVTKNILGNLGKNGCHTTASPGCVSTDPGSSPVSKLFNTWKQGRLEQKLATKYGLVFGSSGTGSGYKMIVNGQSFDISKDNIFDLTDADGKHVATDVTRNKIRLAVRDSLKEATLYDKTFFRFKIGKLLEQKYGIKRCLFACNSRDKFSDSVADKKLAAKAYLLQRILPQKYGLIMTCVLQGGCDTILAKAENGERLSPIEQQLQSQLASYAAKFDDASVTLKSLVASSKDVSENGFKKVVARNAIKAVVGQLGGTDAAVSAAGDATEKAVPIVGWAVFAAQVVNGASKIGPVIKYASYSAGIASAMELYMSYNTAASEQKSGHTDATEQASLSTALSCNITGSKNDCVDFTQSPVYNAYFGSPTTAVASSIFSSLLPGTAFADSVNTASKVQCADGSPIPAGKLICPEERLDKGNTVASDISNITNSVPGLTQVAAVITTPAAWIGRTLGDAIKFIPGFSSFAGWVGSLAEKPLAFVQDKLIQTPFTPNMDGGRQVDMMISAAENEGSLATSALGGVRGTSAQVTAFQDQQATDQKAAFDSKPLFARMFDTSDANSFVSLLAMDMPTNMLTATNNGVTSLLTSPVSKISSVFSSAFSTNKAFAASPITEQFGVPGTIFPADQVQSDPEAYWTANCTGDFTTAYLNNEQQDPNTGEAYSQKAEPCMLLQSTMCSAGLSDPICADSTGSTAAAATPTASVPTTIGYGPTPTQPQDTPTEVKKVVG